MMLEFLILVHAWYPSECCSQKDCRQVQAEATAGGWQVKDGPLVPYGKERASPDGKFHLCQNGKTFRCFFAPGYGT